MKTAQKKKREKHVFSSHAEVCHVWASRSVSWGQAGNIDFDRNGIRSYGYWYMARWYDAKTVLYRDETYSKSTSQHQGHVRNAIPAGIKMFTVLQINPQGHRVNIKHYCGKIAESAEKFARARERATWHLRENQEYASELQAYCKKFRRAVPKKVLPYILDVKSIEVGEKIARTEQQHKVRTVRYDADRAEYEKWLETTDLADNWRMRGTGNKSNKVYLAKHGNKFYPSLWNLPTMLRLSTDGKEIETSQGARVSIEAGRLLWGRLIAGKDIKGHKIGYYTVIAFNGELQIGCHKIERAEINLLAETLGWSGKLELTT